MFPPENYCNLRRNLLPKRHIARNKQFYSVGHGLVEMRLSIEEVVLSGVQMQVHWNPRLLQLLEKSHGFVLVYAGISSTMKDERRRIVLVGVGDRTYRL